MKALNKETAEVISELQNHLPVGYAIVPIQPTPEMLEDMKKEFAAYDDGSEEDIDDCIVFAHQAGIQAFYKQLREMVN